MTIDFGHANPNAKYKVSMARFGWFPDEVHLEGYDDDVGEDGARLERIRDREQEEEEEGGEEGDGVESDLSELTEEE